MALAASPRPVAPEEHVARYLRTGDPEALGALFDATAPVLFRMALSLVHDATAAEDVLQETYLEALSHLARYDRSRPVMPWLVGILEVMARRARRGAARTPDLARVAEAHASAAPPASDESGHGDEALRVRAAIDALDEPYRSVALLRWRYGLDPAEIADVRGEPPGTTRSLLSRALSKMKDALKGLPAFFLLPPAPRGLEGVRHAVMQHAATLAPPAAAAAAGALVLGRLAWIAAGVLAAGVAGVVAWN